VTKNRYLINELREAGGGGGGGENPGQKEGGGKGRKVGTHRGVGEEKL